MGQELQQFFLKSSSIQKHPIIFARDAKKKSQTEGDIGQNFDLQLKSKRIGEISTRKYHICFSKRTHVQAHLSHQKRRYREQRENCRITSTLKAMCRISSQTYTVVEGNKSQKLRESIPALKIKSIVTAEGDQGILSSP